MNTLALTHLSVEDIKEYLLGNPAARQMSLVEEHCISCSECLEHVCALAASVDQTQLAVPPEPVSVPVIRPELVQRWQTMFQGNSWALKTVAATLIMLVMPNSAHLVRLDQLFDTPLSDSAMSIASTRTVPEAFLLMAAPKVELVSDYQPKQRAQRMPARPFFVPQMSSTVPLVEVALLAPPSLDVVKSNSVEPLPLEMEPPQAEAYRSKPNVFKRVLSAFAAPFRSPRS